MRFSLICLFAILSMLACKARGKPKSSKVSSQTSVGKDPLVHNAYVEWLAKYAPPVNSELVSCPSECSLVKIYVEIPRGPDDYTIGHTAISFGERFYDFGPGNSKDGPAMSSKSSCSNEASIVDCPGTRWWSNRYRQVEDNQGIHSALFANASRHSDITTTEVVDSLPFLAHVWPVIEVPLCLQSSSARMAEDWWTAFEKDRPRYQVPGAQCTSAVYASLVHGNFRSDDKIRDQKAGVIGTLQGGTITPYQFSRILMRSPESVIDERMLCGGQRFPLKARRIH